MVRQSIGARLASGVLGAALLLAGAPGAQAHCTSAADQSAFDVAALKSELSVLAVACEDDTLYNAFIERDRSELVREDGTVNSWFKRTYGKAAQTRYDSYITLQANEQSVEGQHEGSDFCPRQKPLFAEVMAVPPEALPEYAAVKNLFPVDVACTSISETAATPATGRAARIARRATKK